ncbi:MULTISPECIES: hypothetical protein [Saccharothrix]|uniref:hypothetical protein n=1 Tax=Saccharothrix TaxID=2071 RepID=UPI00095EE0E6|nr:hypothetical protein [Saccharothrix sp. CB00851]OKI20541.1 hypothetical protein A6A25_37690 [Saccharothrix sp. CB00851]
MQQRHHGPLGDRARVQDHAIGGGQDRGARRGGQVHAAVAGGVLGRRRVEGADHLVRWRQRPGEARWAGGAGGGRVGRG